LGLYRYLPMVNLSFCWLTVRQRAVMGKLPQWHLWIFPSWYREKQMIRYISRQLPYRRLRLFMLRK
jgi:hypothetical protein